ncbi:response regulator transcription factor [Sphingomonas montana]|uniref:response regulator transcription factor n=1 Tax=Sphingomonas montana TaxID=1843236 RepID=UPI00096DFD54|nr:response regulator [Sphingomonas montana]
MALILLVDDDRHVRSSLENLLASIGYDTAGFDSGEALLESDPLPEGDCAILDVRMKAVTGFALQQALRARAWTTPIIFLTACCDDETRTRAIEGGAFAFLCKPFDEDDLLAVIEAAIALAQG